MLTVTRVYFYTQFLGDPWKHVICQLCIYPVQSTIWLLFTNWHHPLVMERRGEGLKNYLLCCNWGNEKVSYLVKIWAGCLRMNLFLIMIMPEHFFLFKHELVMKLVCQFFNWSHLLSIASLVLSLLLVEGYCAMVIVVWMEVASHSYMENVLLK